MAHAANPVYQILNCHDETVQQAKREYPDIAFERTENGQVLASFSGGPEKLDRIFGPGSVRDYVPEEEGLWMNDKR